MTKYALYLTPTSGENLQLREWFGEAETIREAIGEAEAAHPGFSVYLGQGMAE